MISPNGTSAEVLDSSMLAFDEQIVAATVNSIDAYLRELDDACWTQAFASAKTFIGGLYENYAPETSKDGQAWGTLLGSLLLATADIRYGRDELHPRLYSGTYEQNVIATYHHGQHPRDVMDGMFRYAYASNQRQADTYTQEDFVRFPAIAGGHDLIMGNGRGHDERQSAKLTSHLFMRLGMSLLPDEYAQISTEASTWNDDSCRQNVQEAKGFVKGQRAMAVGDLASLFDRRGPYQGICLAPEDLSKRRYDQVFTQEARAAGFVVARATVDDCLQFIDARPTLQAAYGTYLAGQAGFFETFTPADPDLDDMFPDRTNNVQLALELDRAYNNSSVAGRISAYDTLLIAREFQHG